VEWENRLGQDALRVWEIGFARPHNTERAGKIARIGGQQQKYGPGNDRRVSVV